MLGPNTSSLMFSLFVLTKYKTFQQLLKKQKANKDNINKP